ncbi:unnamed protein product [Echinostoma caproni]|uniref:DUF1573 domain-containing protein n=1 Tax=Echinostoma caproni TaxID=27848 RepID=A0A183ARV6_9TREM|nr:unnamed protein product [Echinostoma caproni]
MIVRWNSSANCQPSSDNKPTMSDNGPPFTVENVTESRVELWLTVDNGTKKSAPLTVGTLDRSGDEAIADLLIKKSDVGDFQLHIWFAQTWSTTASKQVAAVTHDGCGKCSSLLLFKQSGSEIPDAPIQIVNDLCTQQKPLTVQVSDLLVDAKYGTAKLPTDTVLQLISERMSVFTYNEPQTEPLDGASCLPEDAMHPTFYFTEDDLQQIAASSEGVFSMSFVPLIGSTYRIKLRTYTNNAASDSQTEHITISGELLRLYSNS